MKLIQNDQVMGVARGDTEHSAAIDQQFTGRQPGRKADGRGEKRSRRLLPLNVDYPASGQIDR
jgi:hypothetical protein